MRQDLPEVASQSGREYIQSILFVYTVNRSARCRGLSGKPKEETMVHQLSSQQENEFSLRHTALINALKAAGVSQVVLTDVDSIFYLTGATFEPLERPFLLLVDADGHRRLLVPALGCSHLTRAWGIADENVATYREFPAPVGETWKDKLVNGKRLKPGFVYESTALAFIAYALADLGGRCLDVVSELRLVKTPWEIAQVERAARYADWGVAQILRNAYDGSTVAESYVPNQKLLRKIIRETPNRDPLATKVICAAWPAPLSAQPHAIPQIDMPLAAGPHCAMVLTRVNGYAAESERTFFTRNPTAREREIFDLMNEARARAFKMVRPGAVCAQIDRAVNDFLAEAGFGEFQTRLHRCGHGFGLGNHEAPWIAEGSTHRLEENMLISIEPGIYVRGAGGYRHSDTVLVTSDGFRCLTKVPTDLASLTLPCASVRNRMTGWLVRCSLGMT